MISVIIPTHNRPKMLNEALYHIYQQRDAEIEVIVLNDVVCDIQTRKVIEKYTNVKYVEDKSFDGPSSKRKRGYLISQGKYIYTPDDDDYLTDDYFFSKCVSILDSDETLSFVSGNTTILNEYVESSRNIFNKYIINVQGRISSIDYIQHFQERYEKPLSTVPTIFRRRTFDTIGISNIIEFSDASIYLMSLLYGDAYIMTDNVAVYRILEGNGSYTYNASKNFIINVLKQRENILLRASLLLPDTCKFWETQYFNMYSFAAKSNLSNGDIIQINLWGFKHSHGSLKILKKSFANITQILLKMLLFNKRKQIC